MNNLMKANDSNESEAGASLSSRARTVGTVRIRRQYNGAAPCNINRYLLSIRARLDSGTCGLSSELRLFARV